MVTKQHQRIKEQQQAAVAPAMQEPQKTKTFQRVDEGGKVVDSFKWTDPDAVDDVFVPPELKKLRVAGLRHPPAPPVLLAGVAGLRHPPAPPAALAAGAVTGAAAAGGADVLPPPASHTTRTAVWGGAGVGAKDAARERHRRVG
eukprot:gene55691-48676_t